MGFLYRINLVVISINDYSLVNICYFVILFFKSREDEFFFYVVWRNIYILLFKFIFIMLFKRKIKYVFI